MKIATVTVSTCLGHDEGSDGARREKNSCVRQERWGKDIGLARIGYAVPTIPSRNPSGCRIDREVPEALPAPHAPTTDLGEQSLFTDKSGFFSAANERLCWRSNGADSEPIGQEGPDLRPRLGCPLYGIRSPEIRHPGAIRIWNLGLT